jgi:hypothetical protein
MLRFFSIVAHALAIQRAYLITGGNEESRKDKLADICDGEAQHMYSYYSSDNEIAVIFSDLHSEIKGMNFDKAKLLAGTEMLGSEFVTETFGDEKRFGIISVTDVEESAYTYYDDELEPINFRIRF